MKRRRQHLDIKRLMFVGSILCILLGTMGSLSLAAFGPSAAEATLGSPDGSVTVFDPFALKAVLVSNVSAAAQPGVEMFNFRPPIRIPFRPAVRSAFRPGSTS